MAKLDKKVWWGLKRDLQNYALGITSQALSVIEIPRSEGQIGYTAKGKGIHLANDHPLMDSMTTKEKVAFITGVFAHELMHKIATHFQELERVRDSFASKYEAKIFWKIANIVEDPSIEAQAKYYFGGWLLKCLHHSIMVCFKEAPPMGDQPMHPFSQFITALIMYGDGGEIKGSFQDLKARLVFNRVLPIVDQCIDERDGKKRVQLQYEIFLKAKPLWKDIVNKQEEMDKLMEELAKIMKDHGKDTKGSGEKPMEIKGDESAEDPTAEKKKRRRKITFRKVSKEELDALRKDGSEGEDDGESDIEVLYSDEEEDEEKPATKPSEGAEAPVGGKKDKDKDKTDPGSGSGDDEEDASDPDSSASSTKGGKKKDKKDASEEKDDGTCGSGKGESSEEDRDDTEGGSSGKPKAGPEGEPESGEHTGEAGSDDEDGDASTTKPGSKKNEGEEEDGENPESKSGSRDGTPATSPIPGMDGDYSAPDYEKEEAIDDSEYELSDSDLERIERMLEEYKSDYAKAENERADCYSEDLSAPSVAADYSGTRCLNKRITCANSAGLEASYARMIESIADGINFLYNQMKRIINNDAAEREYRGTGRLSINRLNCGRMTSRVFERNIDPANKADMCVEILVDESGSMHSDKNWQCAMMCCVGLTEVLAKLHIPTKVIGFTADHDKGYDVTHHHYMHWLNTKEERMNLMNINAHSNNFDGYSIRYATEMIKRRKEQHKILIIISDGAPACTYYYKKNGIIDTTDAVKQAAKKVDIIGVGIGNRDTTVWRTMYGSAFIHVKNAKDLLTNIGKEIQNIMRRW